MEPTGGREGLDKRAWSPLEGGRGWLKNVESTGGGRSWLKSSLEGEGMSVGWGGCACNELCVGTSYPEISNQVP